MLGSLLYIGLSEVQLFQVPEPSALTLLAPGALLAAARRRKRTA